MDRPFLRRSAFVAAFLVSSTVLGQGPPVATPVPEAPPEEAKTSSATAVPRPARGAPPIARQALTPEGEPNDTSATATAIAGASAVLEGNVFPNADVDFYSFTGTVGDRVYAAVMTSFSASASVDSVLDLISTDGTTVIETDADDGSFGTTSSTIAGATLPSTGTFFLRVRHASATAQLRPYRLYFQRRTGAPTAETEPNDVFPGQVLPAGGWVSGTTSSATDADFYSIGLNAGDTVFVSVDLDPERDTTEWNAQVGLGAFGTPPLILVVNDGGTATPDSEAFFMTVQAAGTYGVFVGIPAGGTTFGTYHLSVTVFPATNEGINCTTYTSTNVPVAIPTGPGIVTSTLTVPGNPVIFDMDVSLNITHNFMADLDVDLTSPTGNVISLFTDVGSVTAGSQTTMDCTIDDEAGIPIGQFTVVQGPNFTPELNFRLSWFDGQAAGGTWTLTIRDDAAGDGGSLNAWSLRICEPPPLPACAAGFSPVTVFSTDFEASDAGFTHSGTADEWARGNPTSVPVTGCNSGTNCFKTDLTGGYNASSSQDLLSPNINLAGFSAPVLVTWASKYQIESATFDHALIEARQVGVPTNNVRLFDWLGATMTSTVGNPTVTLQEAAGWGIHRARIDSLAGLNTELRFHLDSDTTVQLAGLAIDDVSVVACQASTADLSITKTDGVVTATPGGSVTYTITASNAGPSAVNPATVADTFPAILTCTWTCVGAGGGTCTAAGSGNVNDTTVNLPTGGSVTYTASCAINPAATGTLVNTATVGSGVTDPNPGNDSATDTDTLTPNAAVTVTKTDGLLNATSGQATTYTIVASNGGPSNTTGTVADTFPAAYTGVTWTCVGAGGGTCTAAGSGNISDPVNLPAGGSVTYTVSGTISGAFTGTLSNTATFTGAAVSSGTDTTNVTAAVAIAGTKTVSGSFIPGSIVTYTVVLTNATPSAQADNPGDEFVDTLPAQLTLNTATASSGTATTTVNTVHWNGAIPASGSVTITITATLSPSVTLGTIVTNQGTINFDADSNGTNESTTLTDDPAVAGAQNPTSFGAAFASSIPTLGFGGILSLVAALAAIAVWRLIASRSAV